MRKQISPLPVRDGIAASVLHLPPGRWPSLLIFLQARFPHVPADVWRARLATGLVVDDAGQPWSLDCPYLPNRNIWYYREVAVEPVVPFAATVLYQDDRLVVADKPHFLASVPGGRHVHETLLTRLRLQLALPNLSPIHRLDRETAGVILFCADPTYRSHYQTLFQQRTVHKEYEAIAGFRPDLPMPQCRQSRLQERSGDFRMEEVEGPPNSQTRISLISRQGAWAHYRLRPLTGKKHQLRAHLAALGVGIAADPWYPALLPDKPINDFSNPLRLLAREIEFVDPVDGCRRCYQSERQLDWPAP